MSRAVCVKCQFSIATCLCDHLVVFKNKLKIIILQHPSEVKVAKNTAKLLALCLADCLIVQGEQEDDFSILHTLPTDTTALLYPQNNAVLLDHTDDQTSRFKSHLTHLVILDGTWKKAYKIKQLTPSLEKFNCVSFDTIPNNRYLIRKAPRADSLSTLEAVAHSLMLIDGSDPSPLYQVLDALNAKQTQFMPEHVKKRYYQQ